MSVFNVHPNAKLIFNQREYGYPEIIKFVNWLCNEIIAFKVRTPIGIVLPRGREQLLACFSALKTGTPYIPISIDEPEKRRNQMLLACRSTCIITCASLQCFFRGFNTIIIDNYCDDVKVDENIGITASPNDLAYIIFTSGSTGKPKGVMINRNNLENFIIAMKRVICPRSNDRIICATANTFDIYLVESVLSLIYGMTVVIANEDEARNPRLLEKLILEQKATILQMTPSRLLLLYLSDRRLKAFHNIRLLMVGGEPFPQWLLQEIQNLTTSQIYNLYGPTEATIWASVADLTTATEVHIGKPIFNMKLHIMDARLNRKQTGDIGEICISGLGVGGGYIHQPDLTNERFVEISKNERLYRTGDLGYELPTGDFVCLGRNDNQVKFHGYRIELEEIERQLETLPEIDVAIVCIVNSGTQVLAACYTGGENVSEDYLLTEMRKKLPTYMVPQRYIKLDVLPLTRSGKVSREECKKKLACALE